jgi:hypothetical protein
MEVGVAIKWLRNQDSIQPIAAGRIAIAIAAGPLATGQLDLGHEQRKANEQFSGTDETAKQIIFPHIDTNNWHSFFAFDLAVAIKF